MRRIALLFVLAFAPLLGWAQVAPAAGKPPFLFRGPETLFMLTLFSNSSAGPWTVRPCEVI